MGVTLWEPERSGKRFAAGGFATWSTMRHPLRACLLPDRSALPRDRRPPLARQLVDSEPPRAALDPLARSPRLALLEAALLLADEPLSPRKLSQVAGLQDGREARKLVGQLQTLYAQEGSAFQVEELAGGFQLLTRAEFYSWLARHRRAGTELKLTPAARETLAIIAYRQPIMRADVEAIRGVQCGEILSLLMDRQLVRIAGRDDSLGRPMLYGTTRKFLQWMG